MNNMFCQPIFFIPTIKEYIWGGQKLKPVFSPKDTNPDTPLAEVWAIYEGNQIKNGPFAGKTLEELTASHSYEILGPSVARQTFGRFPLLIKLLDCADWLSIQVHPNDQQALELEGPGHLGKTEAWHILEAEPGAQLIAGIKPGTSPQSLREAVRNGGITDAAQWHQVQKNDTFLMRAGTLHALGPGLLVYEVQQTSDITYRVYDWDRPMQTGRELHIEKSAAVTDPEINIQPERLASLPKNGIAKLAASQYFQLEMLVSSGEDIQQDTAGAGFHALTVIEGQTRIQPEGKPTLLDKYQSAIIPAACGNYQLSGTFCTLKASVPA
ncbi:MAG: class I mannose-6-phosphate isomerase [Anaerolineales bacterium]|nr:class I mannose-6-phosphate isomerase [Anaerolineales bacterium]